MKTENSKTPTDAKKQDSRDGTGKKTPAHDRLRITFLFIAVFFIAAQATYRIAEGFPKNDDDLGATLLLAASAFLGLGQIISSATSKRTMIPPTRSEELTRLAAKVAERMGAPMPEIRTFVKGDFPGRPPKGKLFIEERLVENLSPEELNFFLASEIAKLQTFGAVEFGFLAFAGALLIYATIFGGLFLRGWLQVLATGILLPAEVVSVPIYILRRSKRLTQLYFEADALAIKANGDIRAANSCLQRAQQFTRLSGWSKFGGFGQPSANVRVSAMQSENKVAETIVSAAGP